MAALSAHAPSFQTV